LGGIPAEGRSHMSKPTTSFWVTPIYVLVPVWLGGRGDRPGFPIEDATGFVYMYLSHRV